MSLVRTLATAAAVLLSVGVMVLVSDAALIDPLQYWQQRAASLAGGLSEEEVYRQLPPFGPMLKMASGTGRYEVVPGVYVTYSIRSLGSDGSVTTWLRVESGPPGWRFQYITGYDIISASGSPAPQARVP